MAFPLAFLLASRLAGPRRRHRRRRRPSASMPWWIRHNGPVGNSEGIMVALDLRRDPLRTSQAARGGRSRWGSAPGLLRPEAWPFLGLYALATCPGGTSDAAPGAARGAGAARAGCRGSPAAWLTLPILWLGPGAVGIGQRLPRQRPRPEPERPNSAAFAEHPAIGWSRTPSR